MVDRIAKRKLRPVHNVSSATVQRRDLSTSLSRMSLEDRKVGNLTYNPDRVSGKGTFGEVYRATIAETGEVVAIKKVFQDRRYKNRELQIMKELNHPNVISLKHAFYTTGAKPDDVFLNIVMDFVPETAYRVMRNYNRMREPVPPLLLKLYSYQTLRGLAYIHACGITHRDIKPQNILIDPSTQVLKLCDFGSAKRLIRGEPSVSYICSRYYRAPELIFGSTEYTSAIDVWSAACVVAELMLGQPLFPGKSAVDQLVEIIKVLGTPSREQILRMNPNYTEHKFPQVKATDFSRVFRRGTPPDAIDFVRSLLTYDPNVRPTPLEALLHPFFDELREQGTCLPNGAPLPPLFNFTPEERESAPADLLARLVPEWFTS